MDEMKLLQDFRAAVAPPDHEVLAQARSRMLAADLVRSATSATNRRRRVRWPQLAISGTAIAAIAITLSIVLPGGADGTFATKAWAVERNPDGTVTVTMKQQFQDPAGLQRALRQDGITAFVQVNGISKGKQSAGLACSYGHLDTASAAVQKAVIAPKHIPQSAHGAAGETAWTIHPSAMPPGSSILFADWVSSVVSVLMHPLVLSTNAPPVCAPTSAS
jgi:hypothetical protein